MDNKQAKKKNGLSVAGFVCALCGFLTCGITSVVGLILSIIGLSNSKKEGQTDGLAIAGIVISAIPLVILVIALATGAGSSTDTTNKVDDDNTTTEKAENDNQETKKQKETKTNERFTLLEHYVSDESNTFAMYIEGKVKNNRNKEYSYVQISFTTYDAEGNIIGSCFDNVNHLDANGTWKFKAICVESPDKIDHYEINEITGW